MGKRRCGQNGVVTKRCVIFSKGPIHLVDCNVRMPSGRVLSRQIIEHPGSIVIVPRLGPDRFLLIRQYRFAARDWLWEFPAGGREPGESPRSAARRELIEETGYRPAILRLRSVFYPTPGVSSEVMHLFFADRLKPDFAEKDEDEEIEVSIFSRKQIERMIRNKKIRDGKTLLGFFFLSYGGTKLFR